MYVNEADIPSILGSKLYSKDAEEALSPKDLDKVVSFDTVKDRIEYTFDYSSSEISIPFIADKRLSEYKKLEKKIKKNALNLLLGLISMIRQKLAKRY